MDIQLPTNNIVFLTIVEIAIVLLGLSIFLLVQNHSLRKLVNKLKSRMEQIVADLKSARAAISAKKNSTSTYQEQINRQIELTKAHHHSLDSHQDIVLDLAPNTDLIKRSAALRHAVLLAEKEALELNNNEQPNWDVLTDKYQQIFIFYEGKKESKTSPESSQQELESINQELASTKKRVANLEKFKALYFELEEKWNTCNTNAQLQFENINEMASTLGNGKEFKDALNKYHNSYMEYNELLEKTAHDHELLIETINIIDPEAAGEIRHLRAIAEEQNDIITELKRRLEQATSEEQLNDIVNELKGELNKQSRFISEAETCVQLMEEELKNAKNEIEQLRKQLDTLPSLRTQLKNIKDQNDKQEQKVNALSSENRALKKKLEGYSTDLPKTDPSESTKLKKEIAGLAAQYAELEEKYLDLKIQQK